MRRMVRGLVGPTNTNTTHRPPTFRCEAMRVSAKPFYLEEGEKSCFGMPRQPFTALAVSTPTHLFSFFFRTMYAFRKGHHLKLPATRNISNKRSICVYGGLSYNYRGNLPLLSTVLVCTCKQYQARNRDAGPVWISHSGKDVFCTGCKINVSSFPMSL